MRRVVAGAVVLAIGCAPELTQIGRDHYRLECEWMPECKSHAARLCPDGYEVEDGKDAVSGSSLTVRCRPPKAAPPSASVAPPPPPEQNTTATLAAECVRDFQCTKPGSRCIDGKCEAPAAELRAEETDACVIGVVGSADPMPIFPTLKASLEFASSTGTSRAATLELVSRLGGTWIDPGVRCKTLRTEPDGRYVQLISGPAAGHEGWIAGGQVAPQEAQAK